jgi:hypothetical protein
MSTLSGTRAIADALDVSPSSALRLIRSKLLRAWKMPGRTSPYRVEREELRRFREALERGEVHVPTEEH